MGCNKALLPLDGRTLIQTVADRVRPLTDQLLLSSDDQTSYRFLDLPTVPDLFRGQGPLAGLHAAMLQSSRELFILLACDMPALHEDLLHRLVSSAGGFDAVIPRTSDGRIHPLCAVYRRTCFPSIESNLRMGINRVTDIFILSDLQVRWLDAAVSGFMDQDFVNLNTPEDLSAYTSGG